MRALRIPLMVAAALILGACHDEGLSSPDLKRVGAWDDGISVLTWNAYVGTNVDAIVEALSTGDPDVYVPVLMAQLDTLLLTDWPARAAAIADEIAARRPEAVGLQEISTFDLSAVGMGTLEFLPIFEAALADRGLNYEVAGSVLNIDAEPMPGLGLKDYDVLFVDADRVTVLSVEARNFEFNLGEFGGVEFIRGFVLARVDIEGVEYTIVSTHLESNLGPYEFDELRYAQALEIVTEIGAAERAIVMGDMNDEAGTLMHQVYLGAGFADTWAALRGNAPGFTCCHLPALTNATVDFDERIDYVFARGLGHPVAGLQGKIDILGNVPSDRIEGPEYWIWPSDHAGLAASFLVAPAEGLR